MWVCGGTSICGGEILDSAQGLPESAYLKHCVKEGSEQLRLTFEKGELKAVNDEKFDDPIKAIQKVEEIGAAYGIGRDMHVGDTIIGNQRPRRFRSCCSDADYRCT